MFPSPTGVTYYELRTFESEKKLEGIEFPSPTGVTYYEFLVTYNDIQKLEKSFRPQQGLPIMNFRRILK